MLHLIATSLVLSALAGPLVVDADRQLTPAQAAGFEQGLQTLGRHRSVVVLMKRAPAAGVEAIAERTFAARKLDRDDLCIAVDVEGRQVAAHVGQDLTGRGLDRAAITAVIGRTFKAPARAGKYDVAALALAQGLTTYRRPVPAAPTPAPAPAPTPDRSLVFQVLIGAAIAWGLYRVGRDLLRGGKPRRRAAHGERTSGWLGGTVAATDVAHDDDADRWASVASSADWSSSASDASSSSSSDSGGSTGSDSW